MSIYSFGNRSRRTKIDLINRKITYGLTSFDKMDDSTVKIVNFSKKEIDEIVNTLIFVDLLTWKKKYIDYGILDGTQWEIEYVIRGKKKTIYGSNNYPEERDRFMEITKRYTKVNNPHIENRRIDEV